MLKSFLLFLFSAPSQPGAKVALKSWLSLAALLIVLDQASKLWISSHFGYGESLPVTGFFNLVLAYNKGAAFSLFASASGWQRLFFMTVATVASVVIVYLLRKHAEALVEPAFFVGVYIYLDHVLELMRQNFLVIIAGNAR